MQSLFCESTNETKLYSEIIPPRRVPTQFLAYQQLQYRYEDKSAPFLVCCVAPAGFRKSTLISAWLHWLYVNHKEKWQTLAPTGIASTQVSGATIHAALLLTADGKSTLHDNHEQLKRFKSTPGFIFDECMMLNQKIMTQFKSYASSIHWSPACAQQAAQTSSGTDHYCYVEICDRFHQPQKIHHNHSGQHTLSKNSLKSLCSKKIDATHEHRAFAKSKS